MAGEITSPEDARLEAFAQRRIARIWGLIGAADVTRVLDKVYREFAATAEPDLWRIFLHGDETALYSVSEKTRQAVQASL